MNSSRARFRLTATRCVFSVVSRLTAFSGGWLALVLWLSAACRPAVQPSSDGGAELDAGELVDKDDAGELRDGGLPDGGLSSYWSRPPLVVKRVAGDYVIEHVQHWSYCGESAAECPGNEQGWVRVWAQVVRPDDSSKRRPIILRAHGGFDGLEPSGFFVSPADGPGKWEIDRAREGYVVASSAYRGEVLVTGGERSGGRVEVCFGEADDLHWLVAALAETVYADPSKVAVWGESHGGCVAERYSTRLNAQSQAVIDWYGPADWAGIHENTKAMQLAGEPPPCPAGQQALCSLIHQRLRNYLERGTGLCEPQDTCDVGPGWGVPGTPQSNPSGYSARRWLAGLTLNTSRAPRMVLQGSEDYLVPKAQGCSKQQALVAAGRTVRSYCYETNGLSSSICNTSSHCPGTTFAPDPGEDWSGHTYFLMVHGLGHLPDLWGALRATQFLKAKMPPVP